MARGPIRKREAEERRSRLVDALAAIPDGPPYPDKLSPLDFSAAALEHLPYYSELSDYHANRLRRAFDDFAESLANYRGRLDPILDPDASFDPGNPDTVGRLVVIALLAQDRVPLAQIKPTYGSGVYAIYYVGSHTAYAEVAGTETPIYVGKADPNDPSASNSRQQGPRLFGRLADHRGAIREVEEWAEANFITERLRVQDFECRRLVCATNAQLVAERHLIGNFHPAWNQESKICFGISKHGDSASTRRNKKSPWDVLHPGRDWAMQSPVKDGMTEASVRLSLSNHFAKHPPMRDQEAIMELMLDAFRQVGTASAEISEAAEHTEEVEAAMAQDAEDENLPGRDPDDGTEDQLNP